MPPPAPRNRQVPPSPCSQSHQLQPLSLFPSNNISPFDPDPSPAPPNDYSHNSTSPTEYSHNHRSISQHTSPVYPAPTRKVSRVACNLFNTSPCSEVSSTPAQLPASTPTSHYDTDPEVSLPPPPSPSIGNDEHLDTGASSQHSNLQPSNITNFLNRLIPLNSLHAKNRRFVRSIDNTPSNFKTLNLSSKTLPTAYYSLLDKGKGFCPTPRPYDTFSHLTDTLTYTRRCRLKEFFHDSDNQPPQIPQKLRRPSSFIPPTGRNAALDLYCQSMEIEASKFVPNKGKLKDKNLTLSEFSALKSLRSDHSITIREADKGGRMVIMDTSDYDLEIKTILSNPATYSPIPSDPSLDINTNLNVLLQKLFKAKIIDENLLKAIRNEPEDIICPHFYGLPKVHKPTLPNHSLPPIPRDHLEHPWTKHPGVCLAGLNPQSSGG